jgi:hypothetical protein
MLKNFSKEKKTTIMGVIQVLLLLLVTLGVINTDESTGIGEALTVVVNALGGGFVVMTGTLLSAAGSIFLLFAKDPDSGEKEKDK